MSCTLGRCTFLRCALLRRALLGCFLCFDALVSPIEQAEGQEQDAQRQSRKIDHGEHCFLEPNVETATRTCASFFRLEVPSTRAFGFHSALVLSSTLGIAFALLRAKCQKFKKRPHPHSKPNGKTHVHAPFYNSDTLL